MGEEFEVVKHAKEQIDVTQRRNERLEKRVEELEKELNLTKNERDIALDDLDIFQNNYHEKHRQLRKVIKIKNKYYQQNQRSHETLKELRGLITNTTLPSSFWPVALGKIDKALGGDGE